MAIEDYYDINKLYDNSRLLMKKSCSYNLGHDNFGQ